MDENTKEKSIPATFQVIYLLGWKPDVSQPKPLKRGSGNVSLKDLHKYIFKFHVYILLLMRFINILL